jgi:hypothetical protein
MNVLRIIAMSLMMLTSLSGWAQSDAQKALDRFKSMVGPWAGKSAQGQPSEGTYRLMAGQTSVMAESIMGDEAMTSLFYVDGDRLLMTHFCPSNNQSRMKATISPDGKTVSFDFLDTTNLASAQTGHLHRAVYVFLDPEHYSEDWTWKRDGKDAHFQLALQRKK